MQTADINDPIWLQAVNALDAGRLDELQDLVNQYPYLVQSRLVTPGKEGYFKDPYLIWFTADNPIRNPKLPENIVEILRFLMDAVKREAADTCVEQLNYTLGLVATGKIPRECGVQLAMMDALIDAGATPNNGMGALANFNWAAANHLIERGGQLTLATALLLNRKADADRLFDTADIAEQLTALTAAAFYGDAAKIKYLLDKGVEPNGYPGAKSGFHSHGTPLHQAVASQSLDAVKLLVEAGARPDMADTLFGGTPLGWALHAQVEFDNQTEKAAYARIAAYLKEIESATP